MASVTLKSIRKVYDNSVVAVNDFCMEIRDKEFVVLVGPSGCGKSTTLRMVAGLEDITGGELFIGERQVNDTPPKDRDISMVFQNYALFPHMTVYDNMAFPLKMRKLPKSVIREKVMEAAEILEITDLLKRRPKALSGGQRQRVAIGRAIVRRPSVFLMDEPLSNLDAKLRNQMRTELIKLRQRLQTTFIYVTHDQTEAMTLGDRIVIMKDGDIQQIGTPLEVYNNPANLFVAGFIGSPQMNILDAELKIADGKFVIEFCGRSLLLTDEKQRLLKERALAPGAIKIGVRPEQVAIAEGGEDDFFEAEVDVVEMLGSNVNLHVIIAGQQVEMVIPAVREGDSSGLSEKLRVRFPKGALHIFDAQSGECVSHVKAGI